MQIKPKKSHRGLVASTALLGTFALLLFITGAFYANRLIANSVKDIPASTANYPTPNSLQAAQNVPDSLTMPLTSTSDIDLPAVLAIVNDNGTYAVTFDKLGFAYSVNLGTSANNI